MTRRLEALRQCVREGRSAAAWALLAKPKSADAGWHVEHALARLLRFEAEQEIEAGLETLNIAGLDAAIQSRWHMARGICCNRQRDPLGALAWLNKGLSVARQDAGPQEQGEVLLEVARVHLWMGSFARAHEDLAEAMSLAEDVPLLRFQVLHRYAEMYAEAERWSQAKRFADRALLLAGTLKDSVHAWQLLDCAFRIAIALGQKDHARSFLSRLDADEDHLPDYLRFRLAVARTRIHQAEGDRGRAATALEKVTSLAALSPEDSYQRIVAAGLAGEQHLTNGRPSEAIKALSDVAQWNEARDLAVPRVRASLLLADAFVSAGRPDDAARLLTRLRDYCARRGLQLQREAVDLCQQRHGLPRLADIESGRQAGRNTWSNTRSYVMLEPLGRGGQGSVFKAHDSARDRLVAYKTLNAGTTVFGDLAREVEALCRAQIPGVAQIIACGTAEDGIPYIVQELVAGKSLRESMPFSASDRRDAISKLAGVARTLDQLHAQGLTHGDVKPENIIDAPDRGLMLVDFGASGKAHGKRSLAGTRAYLPAGLRLHVITPAMLDQHAFGLMLLEVLSGEGPARRAGWTGAAADALPVENLISTLPVLAGIDQDAAGRVLRRLLTSLPAAFKRLPPPLAPQLDSLLR